MRIAFVGKGGSGKSTLSASLSLFISKQKLKPITVFDADLNIHVPELLGFQEISKNNHISAKEPTEEIKRWLIGDNEIENLGAFRKTTPPTRKSNIIKIESIKETPLYKYGVHRDNISVFAVGTYEKDEIGATCYHNSLATFESILNHTDDKGGYIIADMVAGVDSFAGTLHAQFDLTGFVVEPTKRSVEVYKKYIELAEKAGVAETVKVIGNKVREDEDKDFLLKNIPENNFIGFFVDDEHIRDIDRNENPLSFEKLDENNKDVLEKIFKLTEDLPDSRQVRLEKIWELHRKYVSQAFIKDRFGDLTKQIDEIFCF